MLLRGVRVIYSLEIVPALSAGHGRTNSARTDMLLSAELKVQALNPSMYLILVKMYYTAAALISLHTLEHLQRRHV